jgi:voltage-gated potassium channel
VSARDRGPEGGLRSQFNEFIRRHEIAWELVMGGLALVWVAIGFLDQQYGLTAVVSNLELALWSIFLAEFSTRLAASRDRRRYLGSHWIDAVTLLPVLTGFRLLRLIRLLRLVRAFASMYRAAMQFERLARHRGFAALLAVWLGVVVICSSLVFMAENGGPDALIASPFDALWWGVSTITTVGYGDTYPRTPEGRLGAMVLMILGIGLFSAITATITSFILSAQGGPVPDAPDLVAQLRALNDLHVAGALTDAEYGAAKSILLAGRAIG